jgi:ubiquitin carboxyl-terminal hydrolase L3
MHNVVMNSYIEQLGFDTSLYQFCDVLSTEDWALEMVPSPVIAVLQLFPVKPVSEIHREEEYERIMREGQEVPEKSEFYYYLYFILVALTYYSRFYFNFLFYLFMLRVYYMKQTIGNACGTIGLLHAIGNVRELEGVNIRPDSYLSRLFSNTLSMSPDERGAWLEQDDEIEVTHEAAAGKYCYYELYSIFIQSRLYSY